VFGVGAALIIFWGRGGLPVPYREPILGAMGKPIAVPLKESPTDDEIDSVHQELMAAMLKLFDEHKESYGWGHKKLIIQ
jgi:diacylglycerol O-acyltransferase 2, plant